MRLEECFKKGLLRRRRPDKLKSKRALELAGMDLERAKKLLEKGFYMESTLLSYTGMFQAARALLFKDGIMERSHACVIEYLKEHYVKRHIIALNHVNWLNSMRVERHETLYGLERKDVTREEAEDSYRNASMFIEEIKTKMKNSS
jgi:uncharacterized protein (UPF0332 family)